VVRDFDEALNLAGGVGKFQLFSALILVTSIVSGECIINNLAYYELMPTY